MTTTDWLVDIALVLIVFLQLRERKIDGRFILLPIGIIALVVRNYLHSIPTAGHDLMLIGSLVGVGAVLGIGSGVFTRVRFDGRQALVKAGAISAALWVLGMGSRMAFQLWSQHGGGRSIAQFSSDHQITSEQAWVAALVLMALTEVMTRMATILLRAYAAYRVQAAQQRAVQPSDVFA